MALGAASSVAQATIFPEIEPNNVKSASTVVGAMLNGDVLTGTTTGSSTTVAGLGSADSFRISTAAAPPGIYRHRLTITTAGGAGHTGFIMGLPASGAASETTAAQASAVTTTVPRTNQWYGFGHSEQIYYRIIGTASTTAAYSVTLSDTLIGPTPVAGTVSPGTVTLTTVGQGHSTDTEIALYDSSFNILRWNDDEPSPGTTLQSTITQTLSPGTYFVAITRFNMAITQPLEANDRDTTGNRLDFPDGICSSSSAAVATSVSFAIVSGAGTVAQSASIAESFGVEWFVFTVADPVGACCFNDGSCIDMSASGCSANGGSFQGGGTICAPNPCPQPAACCFNDGTCAVLLPAACAGAGGAGGGAGTICVPNPCPQPSACCLPGDICLVRLPVQCGALGGIPNGNPDCGNVHIHSSAPGIPIADNANWGPDTISIYDTYFVGDVNVRVDIRHSFLGDLTIFVKHGGTTVQLWSGDCGGNDNLNATADDQAASVVCATPTVAAWNPNSTTAGQFLSAFAGVSVVGDWSIFGADTASGDTGSLDSWSLIIGESCHKHDYLTTCGQADVHIGTPGSIYPPIPPEFFGPGSDPFIGTIHYTGVPLDPTNLGLTDTIVRRDRDPVGPLDPIGTIGSTPIEIVALSLVSVNPITVTYGGGATSLQWNVHIDLSSVPQSIGGVQAVKTHMNGGDWTGFLPVQPRFTFTPVIPGPPPIQFDAGVFGLPPIPFNFPLEAFVHTLGPSIAIVNDSSSWWKPGVRETIPGDPNSQVEDPIDPDAPGTAHHGVCPPPQKRCIYRITCIEGTDCVNLPVAVGGLIAGSPCPNGTCSTAIFHPWGNTNCCVHAVLIDCAFTTAPVMPITGAPCPCTPRGACCLPGGCVENVRPADCAAGGGFYYGDGSQCPICDDNNDCTDDQCNPLNGACIHIPKPFGTPCADDGNLCTLDICDGQGNCTHPFAAAGTPCADDGNPCTDDICDGSGNCIHPPKPAGTPCGIGGPCIDLVCDGAGGCVTVFRPAGSPCADDGNPCTDDVCDGLGNCIHPPKAFGTLCGPGGNCHDDVCDGFGNCISIPKAAGTPCGPVGPCFEFVCDGNGNCVQRNRAAGTPCPDDGNPCTDDVCNGLGACTHPPRPFGAPCADDGNPCTDDICNGLGACIHPPKAAGTPCADDGDPCTDDFCDGNGNCRHVYVCEACCFPNGSCQDLRPAACLSLGGSPRGPGTICAPGLCVNDPCAGVLVGDANCDNRVNNFDIDFFVQGILFPPPPDNSPAPPAYLAIGGTQACWAKRRCWGDINCDGAFNNFDIDFFVPCILTPPPPGIGCPTCAPQACCLPGPACSQVYPAACTMLGGVPQGAGSSCPVICP